MLPSKFKYEDVDVLLEACSEVKAEIISVVDGCMAQQP